MGCLTDTLDTVSIVTPYLGHWEQSGTGGTSFLSLVLALLLSHSKYSVYHKSEESCR